MVEPTPTLDLALATIEPRVREAGFENAGSDDNGTYAWQRLRRAEHAGERRFSRVITVSHASAGQAFLADAYMIARDTRIQTPVGREVSRYGTPAEAAAVAAGLAATVLAWVDA